jgi:enterochelin esterase family protein
MVLYLNGFSYSMNSTWPNNFFGVTLFRNGIRPWVGLLILLIGTACALQSPPPTEVSVVTSHSTSQITPTPACNEDGVVKTGKIDSPVNGLPLRFQVYLPPCYEAQTWAAYPVFYLIHGRGGGEASWNGAGAAERVNQRIRSGNIPPIILVTPANDSGDRYGVALTKDLVPYIDRNFRTLPDREHRVVGGGSRGATVAARMAFQFPDIFGSIGAFGGGMVNGDEPNFDDWISDTPPERRPRVLIDIGDQDTIMPDGKRLAAFLDKRDVPYTFNIEPGDHSYGYWMSNMDMYLNWYVQDW